MHTHQHDLHYGAIPRAPKRRTTTFGMVSSCLSGQEQLSCWFLLTVDCVRSLDGADTDKRMQLVLPETGGDHFTGC